MVWHHVVLWNCFSGGMEQANLPEPAWNLWNLDIDGLARDKHRKTPARTCHQPRKAAGDFHILEHPLGDSVSDSDMMEKEPNRWVHTERWRHTQL